jgi:molecular chaperone GrpE
MSEKNRENAAAAGAEDRERTGDQAAERAGGPAPGEEDPIAAAGEDPTGGEAAGAGADMAADAAEDRTAADEAEDGPVDPVAVLEEEVVQLREALAAERDRVLRTAAELDNLRKRSRRDVQEAHRFARAEALRPMLEVLDNFDRALQHAGQADADPQAAEAADPAAGGDDQAFRQGVEMIAQSLRQALRDQGVEPIAAVGEPFDPAHHEAVGQQPAPEGTESGTVIAVVQEGYRLGELVLRASRVIVAQ